MARKRSAAQGETLFAANRENQPLAARVRPRTLDEFVGQEHLLAPGKPLREAVERGVPGSMIFWGLGVRMVYVMHVTWFVNSATHLWGYRNYETTDNSRNLWWVGLLAFGEGWHNNHHAYQRVASQGHKWWEIDVTYWCIWMMEKVGLAWDVVRVKDIPKGVAPA